MPQYPLLQEFLAAEKATKIEGIDPALAKEIGNILKAPDDIAGAFEKFKKAHKLTQPGVLGKMTAQYLLDYAGQPHPKLDDTPAVIDTANLGTKTGKSVSLLGTTTWENEFVVPGVPVTWGEVTKGLTRIPENDRVVKNIRKIAARFGEIRQAFGSPIGVTSGYRPTKVNRAVGGASASRHIQGDALDIYPLNGNFSALKEAILRVHKTGGFGDGVSTGRGFYHIDCRPTPYLVKWNY